MLHLLNPARRCTVVLALLLLAPTFAGCTSDPLASAEAEARANGPTSRPEWEREVTHRTGMPAHPIAFRAGGGLVSLLQGPPLERWRFTLADSGRSFTGGPINPDEQAFADRPFIRNASDVVGISADGFTWLLDPATGRVTGENVGGYRHLVAGFGVRGRVRTACALGERAIAYIDDARPGEILVRGLGPSSTTRTLPFPPGLFPLEGLSPSESGGATGPQAWTSLRFGGSSAGPCILHAPQMRGVVVVSDSAARAITPFVEPLTGVDDVYAARAWYLRAADLMTRREPHAGAIDATSFPGGVAVLFEGRTTGAGRVVDLYTESGEYVETMRLPHRALGIAATRHRLLVLGERYGQVFLSSYILPARARAGAPMPPEPEVIAPVPPRHGDALPPDTIASSTH